MATALLAVYDAVLLRPLPVQASDRIVVLRAFERGDVAVPSPRAEVDALGGALTTASEVAGLSSLETFMNPLIDGDRQLILRAAYVTGNFFELLGARPELGRLFSAEDERPGTAPSSPVVLSYDTWKRDFGGDSAVLGRHLDGPYDFAEAEVIGVAPPGLAYPTGVSYWAPMSSGGNVVIARLAPGATAQEAEAEFLATMRSLRAPRLELHRAHALSLGQAVVGTVRPQLRVVLVAAVLLLVIALVNVGSLTMLRATERHAEIAIRMSLGAVRWQVLRPLAWESTLLALGGSALGIVFAHAFLGLIGRVTPSDIPRLDILRASGVPVRWEVAVTLAVLLLAGLVPAFKATAGEFVSSLRGHASAALGNRRRTPHALVPLQAALAFVTVAGAALLTRSLDRLTRIPLGYRADGLSVVLIAKPVSPDSTFMSDLVDLYERIAPAVRSVPGVEALTPVNDVPFGGTGTFTARWAVAGQSDADAALNPFFPYEVGGPEYFRTMGIPLLRGRGFLETDTETAPRVAVVSRAFAGRYWPGENPIGKQIRLTSDAPLVTVVGEAGDIRYRSLRETRPTVYQPYRQVLFQGRVAVRANVPLREVLPAMQSAVRAVDPEAVIAGARSVEELVDGQVVPTRVSMLLLSIFGTTALALVMMGLYSILAVEVRNRFRELGLRLALGATPVRLRAGVVARALTLTSMGALIGVAASVAGFPFIATILYEVPVVDPVALLGSSILLFVVALAAALFPAARATRTDPARALRGE